MCRLKWSKAFLYNSIKQFIAWKSSLVSFCPGFLFHIEIQFHLSLSLSSRISKLYSRTLERICVCTVPICLHTFSFFLSPSISLSLSLYLSLSFTLSLSLNQSIFLSSSISISLSLNLSLFISPSISHLNYLIHTDVPLLFLFQTHSNTPSVLSPYLQRTHQRDGLSLSLSLSCSNFVFLFQTHSNTPPSILSTLKNTHTHTHTHKLRLGQCYKTLWTEAVRRVGAAELGFQRQLAETFVVPNKYIVRHYGVQGVAAICLKGGVPTVAYL